MASWYGEEFAGRPTANGEIFDPQTMTAAHRSLPFGTILDVTNLKNGRSTRVRINDRGPFVGNRIIDLSYAAARSLDMVEDGVSRVRLDIVRLGRGDREPPEPYSVSIDETPTEAVPQVAPVPVRTIDEGPADRGEQLTPTAELIPETSSAVTPPAPAPAPPPEPAPVVQQRRAADVPSAPSATRPTRGWKVQVGAFGVEENARRLSRELSAQVAAVYVETVSGLFRVRIGPFESKVEAIEASERVHSLGYDAIVLSPDAR